MSQATQQTVTISKHAKTERHYHIDSDCSNYPDETKEVDRKIAEDWYLPCSLCAGEKAADDRHNNNTGEYQCVDCGATRTIGSNGVRTLAACHDCDDVTTWDRL